MIAHLAAVLEVEILEVPRSRSSVLETFKNRLDLSGNIRLQ